MNETSIEWALQDIEYLERERLITPEMAQRGRDLVGLIFQPTSVFAAVCPIDDGDLSFYWVAGERSISVDLYEDGGGWYRARNGQDDQTHEGGTPDWLHEALEDFSECVESVNPNWRELRIGLDQ